MRSNIADTDEISNLKDNIINNKIYKRRSKLDLKYISQVGIRIFNTFKYLIFIILGFMILFIMFFNLNISTEVDKILAYYYYCKAGKLLEKIKNDQNLVPLVSIIIPTYNKKDEILPLLRSIQNQSFKKLEIVFVDDNSNDGTSETIKKHMMVDSRITIRKHDVNKGTLISRNDGAKISRGKYLLFIDPDDMLLEGILEKVYKIAENNKTDIVEFEAIKMNEKMELREYYPPFKKMTELKQPNLSYIMYNYTNHKLSIQSIWGKLIKKSIFIKSMESIRDYYLEQYMCLNEGLLMSFAVFQNANSYIYYNKYGYLYRSNSKSMSSNKRKLKNVNKSVKSLFLYEEFLNEYTGNNTQKKKMGVYHFERMNQNYCVTLTKVTEGFDYLWKVLNSYLDSKYIEDEDKKIVREVAEKIKLAQKNATKII